jgi:Domain of unknown function (DUF4399)
VPRLLSLVACVLLLSAVSCGGGGNEDTGAAAVSVVSPASGATVTSPVQVVLEAEGFAIEPAGDVAAGAGHFHLMVDTACVSAGEQIPSDEAHLHLADGTSETRLELAVGEHTLCLQAGDGRHSALDLTSETTFEVTARDGGTPTETGGDASEDETWEGTYDGDVVWDCGPAGMKRGTLDAVVKIVIAVSGDSGSGRLIGAIPGPATITLVFDLHCATGC